MRLFSLEELEDHIEHRILKALHKGHHLPFHFVAVGTNGSMVGGSFYRTPDEGKLILDILIEHSVGEGIRLPVIIAATNEAGESLSLRVSETGTELLH